MFERDERFETLANAETDQERDRIVAAADRDVRARADAWETQGNLDELMTFAVARAERLFGLKRATGSFVLPYAERVVVEVREDFIDRRGSNVGENIGFRASVRSDKRTHRATVSGRTRHEAVALLLGGIDHTLACEVYEARKKIHELSS